MLYLIDKPKSTIGVQSAKSDSNAVTVLIQDGVALSPDIDGPVYYLRRDADVRGVEIHEDETITYEELIELIDRHPVRSFI